MSIATARIRWTLHPLNAVLPAGAPALFLGALLSDTVYFRSCEVAWNNFSSWLPAGGLVNGALALQCVILALVRAPRAWPAACALLLWWSG